MHAPTVYFPLIVHEAMMIEPTETEDVATLDRFAGIMEQIDRESREDPEVGEDCPAHHAGPPPR